MQVNYQMESDTKPKKFVIENILNGNCDIIINDNIKKVTETSYNENQEEITIEKYVFNSYRLTTQYRDELEEELSSKNGYKVWLDFVIKQSTDEKAKEVRAIRDKLLSETDKDMCIDRLGIDIPENITATNLLSVVKSVFVGISNILNNDTSKYRQALRDIPQQKGFPYNVIWPTKKD